MVKTVFQWRMHWYFCLSDTSLRAMRLFCIVESHREWKNESDILHVCSPWCNVLKMQCQLGGVSRQQIFKSRNQVRSFMLFQTLGGTGDPKFDPFSLSYFLAVMCHLATVLRGTKTMDHDCNLPNNKRKMKLCCLLFELLQEFINF